MVNQRNNYRRAKARFLAIVLCAGVIAAVSSFLTATVILIAFSGLFSAAVIFVLRESRRRSEFDHDRRETEIAMMQAEVLNRVVDARCRAMSSAGNFLVFKDGRPEYYPRPAAPNTAETARPEQPPEQSYPPLLPVLLDADRILIVGGMGSGKTTLLKHLIRRQANPVILDPHATPQTWPCETIGIGRDYEAIEAEIIRIGEEMNRRYQLRAAGQTRFPGITLIIDELTVLTQFLELGEHFKSFLCEARKANIRLIFAGQSDRVRSIGIQGNGDLRAGFDAVCYLKRESGIYLGEIDGQKYEHPGPYPGGFKDRSGSGGHPGQCRSDRSDRSDRPFYGYQDRPGGYHDRTQENVHIAAIDYHPGDNPDGSAMEETARRMRQTGESVNSICRTLFGKKTAKSYYATRQLLKDLGF